MCAPRTASPVQATSAWNIIITSVNPGYQEEYASSSQVSRGRGSRGGWVGGGVHLSRWLPLQLAKDLEDKGDAEFKL